MDGVDTATLSFDGPQQTSLDASTSELQLTEIVVEDPSSSSSSSSREHHANETTSDEREQIPQITMHTRRSLYRAVLTGDWQSAEFIFENNQGATRVSITQQGMNALQVAVAAKHTTFVRELLFLMHREDLEFQNINGDTVLAIAALSGNVEIAREIVNINSELPMIRNLRETLPLLTAASHKDRDMVLYLYSVTEFDILTPAERIQLLLCTIFCDMFDKAHEILRKDPTLATAEDENGCTALQQLAKKPNAIGTGGPMSTLERVIAFFVPGIAGVFLKGLMRGYLFLVHPSVYRKKLMRTLAYQLVEALWTEVQNLPSEQRKKYSSTIFLAAEFGNVVFLTILLRADPELIWMVDENERNIFHISILYRQENIFNLIYEIGIFKDMIASACDNEENNMLHLAGKLAPLDRLNIKSGAALQMQRELLWFKEVEKIVPLTFLDKKNLNEQKPKDVFIKTHKKLQKEGEKWMRSTSTNCMLVATLIATIVFAAAFTVPGGNDPGGNDQGGNDQLKGTPIFLDYGWFTTFFISDSVALLFSTSSVLIFLSILTSRYSENDFLYSLPMRLVIGLGMLFISIVAMVLAFYATCCLAYQNKKALVPSVTILLACVPILCFVVLHGVLFIDIALSTFWSRSLFQSSRRRLF